MEQEAPTLQQTPDIFTSRRHLHITFFLLGSDESEGVGQRNYHYFFGFISCVLVLALMVLPASWRHTDARGWTPQRGYQHPM